MLESASAPRSRSNTMGSIYCPVNNSGSKDYTRYGFREPESLNGQYMDPLGLTVGYMKGLLGCASELLRA